MKLLMFASVLTTLTLGTASGRAEDKAAALLKDIKQANKGGEKAAAARAAWDQLTQMGPEVLIPILEAMDSGDPVVVNWLATAFDRITERDLAKGGKGIDDKALLILVRDKKQNGRARRLSLELLDRVRPGTSASLVPSWLEDPEFRYEGVDYVQKQADALASLGQKDKAITHYRKAFDAARDLQQVKSLAVALGKMGVTVSGAEHLGFLMDWYVIGPWDAKGMKGFKTAYPPEEKIDLVAKFEGKSGTIRWKRYRVQEASPATSAHVALVNLRTQAALGDAEDAVAFAYTEISVPNDMEVEFRGAADDNFTIWVNGKIAFGFEEYRNGVRFDRHRFKVNLKAGKNTILVKICQAPTDPTNNEPNWEFLLRIVDGTGKGIQMKSSLPREKE